LLGVLAFAHWKLRPLRKQVSELGQRIAESQWQSQLQSQSAPDTVPSQLSLPPSRLPITSPPSVFPSVNTRSPSINVEMLRLQADLSARSEELERMRREAHLDPLTGLPKRQHFMARLEAVLGGSSAWPATTVLLLRVRDLAGVNHRVGHEAANRVLRSLARALRDLVDGDPGGGSLAGRLNGADFGLLMPVTGASRRTAETLLESVRRAWSGIDPEGGLAIGLVDLQGPSSVKQAMALLDEALSRAEAQATFSVVLARHGADQHALGSSAWQQRLADALAKQRAVLAEYPVCGPAGELLHLDCPMRVQFEDGGTFESAWRWLAPAARGRYCAELDLLALQMALDAITGDKQSRCINLSAQALDSSAFIASVTRELKAWPEAARALWIDVPESVATDRPAVLQEASRQWRPLGARLALEHAGERLGRIEHLESLGLDCIRVDGAFLRGLTGPDSINGRRHLKSIVTLVHVAGLSITAEGVSTAGDLSMVWALGFDAATGPAVQPKAQSMSPQ
jgi:predicted signal transduction protein with EAL and GGDEF domain